MTRVGARMVRNRILLVGLGRQRCGTFQRTGSTHTLSWRHAGRIERKRVWLKDSEPGEGRRQIRVWRAEEERAPDRVGLLILFYRS